MLVLSRKENEKIRVGENIEVTVLDIIGRKVRLGFSAPGDVRIIRHELIDQWPGSVIGNVVDQVKARRGDGYLLG